MPISGNESLTLHNDLSYTIFHVIKNMCGINRIYDGPGLLSFIHIKKKIHNSLMPSTFCMTGFSNVINVK